MTRGTAEEANPADGDRIGFDVDVRDGRVYTVGVRSVVVAGMTWIEGGRRAPVEYRTGADARRLGGEAFRGCEIARHAALTAQRLAHAATVEAVMDLDLATLIEAMGSPVPPANEACVLTAIAALRGALINAQVSALAEATVEARRLRVR